MRRWLRAAHDEREQKDDGTPRGNAKKLGSQEKGIRRPSKHHQMLDTGRRFTEGPCVAAERSQLRWPSDDRLGWGADLPAEGLGG